MRHPSASIATCWPRVLKRVKHIGPDRDVEKLKPTLDIAGYADLSAFQKDDRTYERVAGLAIEDRARYSTGLGEGGVGKGQKGEDDNG